MTKIVGIDLGTTFSAIAELDDLGNPEVLSDPESGNRITRSAVYFGKDKVIVGEKARDASITSPKKVVFEVKRKMEDEVIYSLSRGEIKEDDGKSYVLLQNETTKTSEKQFITTGFTDVSQTEITSGLEEGNIILIESQIVSSTADTAGEKEKEDTSLETPNIRRIR